MKKIMFMAAAAFMTTAAMAQNPDGLKQVLAAKDYQEAAKLVEGAASSMTAEEKAKAYNKIVDLAVDKYNKEQNIVLTNQVTKKNDPYDKVGMYAAAMAALEAANECDRFDQMPNDKGKVKAKFRKSNALRLVPVRNAMINAGQDLYNEKDFTTATKAFGLYIDSKSYPLFSEGGLPEDQYYGQIAYFASLSAYNDQNFVAASKYAEEAQADTAVANDALDIMVLSMKAQLKTKEDSLKYLGEIKRLYDKNKSNERFFSLLTEYYSSVGDKDAKNSLIASQVAANPDSKMAWALKGESDMGDSNWDGAIEAYKKSLEIDPTFIQVRFNLALCLNNKAITLKEANNGNLNDEAKALLQESIKNLNDVKKADPNREMVNWAYTLYQAYYLIGDEANAKEVEALLNNN